MSSNGHPRAEPRIEIVAGSPSSTELAAAVIAIERMLAEDAAASAGGAEPQRRWQRAALLEGVAAKDALGTRWGVPPARR